jgi:hypothetical protein
VTVGRHDPAAIAGASLQREADAGAAEGRLAAPLVIALDRWLGRDVFGGTSHVIELRRATSESAKSREFASILRSPSASLSLDARTTLLSFSAP